MKEKILNFLKRLEPKLCVLATASEEGKPQSTVMGYAVKNDLTIILCTDKSSRKVQNLRRNENVSLIFGWSFDELNLQYEGVARIIESGAEFKTCEADYFASHPESLEFKGTPETIFLEVKPTWFRLSDYTATPPLIEEQKVLL